jgi:AraC-like DNA-binding protein
VVLDAPGLCVAEVSCPGHGTGWSAPEPIGVFGIVLVRRGVFRRRVRGVPSVVDPATAYVQLPGTEQQIAHPAGGDLCTSVQLRPDEHDPLPCAGPVPVTPRIGLVHRLLVARARAGAGAVALTDLAAELVTAVLAELAGDPDGGGHHPSHRRLVDSVRELLACDAGYPLPELAGRLGVSPYHLSRVFHRTTGVTFARYRIRLRTSAALERLAAGEQGLAALAADLGFADQAHLTRTLRAETGVSPGRLRTLLAPPRA